MLPDSWREEQRAGYFDGFRDGEASERGRGNGWQVTCLFVGAGGVLGFVSSAVASFGGTNPETGEPRVPFTIVVDSFLERIVWGMGAGAAIGALILLAIVAYGLLRSRLAAR